MIGKFRAGIDPVVNFFARDHECVTKRHRVDGHEDNTHIVLPNKRPRNVAVNNAGENCRHYTHPPETGKTSPMQ